ncbi:hypothetical protein, partial ['Chrysanthemum coronarium' phytoplasma]
NELGETKTKLEQTEQQLSETNNELGETKEKNKLNYFHKNKFFLFIMLTIINLLFLNVFILYKTYKFYRVNYKE